MRQLLAGMSPHSGVSQVPRALPVGLHSGRPIACALFPEYCFVVEHPELIVRKHIFQGFPCIQKPCSISPRRRTALQQLSEMFAKEIFLSSFYLFGISPFVIDLKNIAGEALERIPVSENGKTTFPHHRLKKSFL
jgi:hypothetical protein